MTAYHTCLAHLCEQKTRAEEKLDYMSSYHMVYEVSGDTLSLMFLVCWMFFFVNCVAYFKLTKK